MVKEEEEEVEYEITAMIVIEILGTPKKHVENTMKLIIEKLQKEKGIQLLRQTTYKSEKQEKTKFWSTFAEIELKAENIKKLTDLCFDYMPSSVEIMEPAQLKMETTHLTHFLNDLQARLHKYDMLVKNLHAENTLLKKKMGES